MAGVESDLGCLCPHHAHIQAEVLVLLPVLLGEAVVVGKAVVLEAGVQVEAVVLEGGGVKGG